MLVGLMRHDRALVLAGLTAVIALSWVWLMTGAGLQMEKMDMGGGQIMLMADNGDTWRFEADDNAQWRLVPDSADPLIMLRQ